VEVFPRSLHLDLHEEQPALPVAGLRAVIAAEATIERQRGIGGEQFFVRGDEGGQARTTALFLAIEEELDVTGERHSRRAKGVDRLQVGEQIALGVGRPAPVHDAVAYLSAEWRPRPFSERLGGLDIVVVIDHEGRRVGIRRADLAVDNRQADGFHHARRDTEIAHHLDQQRRALPHADPLRGDARLPHHPL